MSTFQELPENVLHDVIAAAIDSTRFRGWQVSLRLVNHQFNEAVLHVFYLRKKIVAYPGGHLLDCSKPSKPCRNLFCRKRVSSRLKNSYAVRFTFQSFLATHDLPRDSTKAYRLVQQWEEALTTLRGLECVERLNSDQISLYSTCSNNPIFNDPCSAILSDAISSYLGPGFLMEPARGVWVRRLEFQYQAHPPAFWVALCACVLGDAGLLETCVSKLASIVEKNPPKKPSDPSTTQWLTGLLKGAINRAEPRLVSHILERHSSTISEVRTNYAFLQAAIFSRNNEVLKTLLEYIPNSPDLLTDALSHHGTLLPQSSSGSETIRLLTQHFAPLSAASRTWLIIHSCSVGDVTLLEEFSNTGPLFGNRINDADGRKPTCVQFAICRGNVDTLRFLLDHGLIEDEQRPLMHTAIDHALSFNQIQCYQELYQRFDTPRLPRFFPFLGMVENSEEIMADFMKRMRIYLLQTFEEHKDPQPTHAQRALWNSIRRLRPGNTRFLLDEGVRVFPWQQLEYDRQSEDPCEIPWPYFNLNRDAFTQTQAVLDAFGLPKLRVVL